MMRIVDVIYAVPAMIYMILLMLIFGSNVYSVMLGICVNGWVNMARIVRSQVMTLKEQEFAVAAFVIGADRKRILFRHLLLNCLGPVIVTVTLMIPQAIFNEAFLSFIGIGISAPMASLGTLAQDARMLMNVYPMQMVWPVLVICIVIFSLNFIGEGLETAMNPRGRRA
jgi:oligopeptide transport system permease protein